MVKYDQDRGQLAGPKSDRPQGLELIKVVSLASMQPCVAKAESEVYDGGERRRLVWHDGYLQTREPSSLHDPR